MSEPATSRVPLGPFLAFGYVILSLLLTIAFLSIVAGMSANPTHDFPSVGLAMFASSVLLAVAIDRFHGGEDALALRLPSLSAIPLAFVSGAALAPIADFLNGFLVKRFPLAGDAPVVIGDDLRSKIATAVTLLLVIPFAEELLFRGAILGALRDRPWPTSELGERPVAGIARMPAVPGAVFIALGLSVLFEDPRGIPAKLLLAASATLLRLRTRALFAAVAFHVGYLFRDVVGIFSARVEQFNVTRVSVLAPSAVAWVLLLLLTVRVGAPKHAVAS